MMTGMEKMTLRDWVIGLAVLALLFALSIALGPGWFAHAYGGV